MIHARVEKKDHNAIEFLGGKYFYGELGLQKDMRTAVHLWSEAAELGSIEAMFRIGYVHHHGKGVRQDEAKAAEFYTKAAMLGQVESRYNLGWFEGKKGNHGRAVRHYLISARLGDEGSLEMIKKHFTAGFATKEQYAQALRGYQDAVEETKSRDRDDAKRLGF